MSYFHVRVPTSFDGETIEPGTWGTNVAVSHLHGWAVVEYHFESVRRQIAPHLPSRRTSAFAFTTLGDAIDYRESLPNAEAHSVYEVEPVEPDAAVHITNMRFIGPELEERYGLQHVIRNAIGYWNGDVSHHVVLEEAIIASALRVIREVEPATE